MLTPHFVPFRVPLPRDLGLGRMDRPQSSKRSMRYHVEVLLACLTLHDGFVEDIGSDFIARSRLK